MSSYIGSDVRRFLVIFALTVLAQAACAQMRYVVSANSQAYTPATLTHALTLGDNETSQIIEPGALYPSSFDFRFFGADYDSFQVCSNGFLFLTVASANASTFAAAAPDHSLAGGRVVAPYWADLIPGGTSSISWEMQGDTLVVQWADVSVAGGGTITMAAHLDSASDTLEFHYAGTATPPAATSAANTVALSSSAITGMWITNGEVAGFVNTDGSVAQWPGDTVIHFDIPSGVAPTIGVTVQGQPATHQLTITLGEGTYQVLNQQIVITVDDPDAQPTTLRADMFGGTGAVQSEWEVTAGSVPYNVQPTSGSFASGGTFTVQLHAEDGDWSTVFVLQFTVQNPSPGTGGTGPPIDPRLQGKFPKAVCAAENGATDCRPVVALLAVVCCLARLARRKTMRR